MLRVAAALTAVGQHLHHPHLHHHNHPNFYRIAAENKKLSATSFNDGIHTHMDEATALLKSALSQNIEEDADVLFGKMIAASMRAFPPSIEKDELKIVIQQKLLEFRRDQTRSNQLRPMTQQFPNHTYLRPSVYNTQSQAPESFSYSQYLSSN